MTSFLEHWHMAAIGAVIGMFLLFPGLRSLMVAVVVAAEVL